MIAPGRLLNLFVSLLYLDSLPPVFLKVAVQTCFKRHFFTSSYVCYSLPGNDKTNERQ